MLATLPETFIISFYLSFLIAQRNFRKIGIQVNNLEAMEEIGFTTCIISDQTNTLLQNKMTVEHLWYNQQVVDAHTMSGP